MKKTTVAIIAAAMLCGLCSCGNKVPVNNSGSVTSTTTASSEQEAATEESESASSEKNSAEKTTETSKESETTAAASGAEAENSGDKALISKAQDLFERACTTSFNFSVGCPYELDTSSYIENDYGWHFYLITDPDINSVDDIKADYHKVFSDSYPDNIDETFIDGNGHAYCLNGARGSDIFYVKSEIVSVDKKTDSEIFFTVRNYYDGSDWGDSAYTEDKAFSAVIQSDGSWRAGTFTLPY